MAPPSHVLLLCALVFWPEVAVAIVPSFTQTTNLVNSEGAAGVQTVNGFIVALLDGDMGTDGFTGTAADAVVVNIAPNSNFFTVPPTVSVPVGGASPAGAPGPVGCDPAPGCSLTLTYELAPYASGVVTFQVQIRDAAGEAGALQTTTLTINEVNNPPLPTLASATGLPATPVTAPENAGAQTTPLLSVPIPAGPPPAIAGTVPFGQEAAQTIASIICVPTNPALFAAMGGPAINPATGALTFTPERNRVGTTLVTCTVLDSADDPLSTADDGTVSFSIRVVAGQDCADGEAGALACDGTHQTCFDDGMPDGDNLLNNNFVCVCNNGGQRASRQAAPLCDDCAAGSAGALACTDAVMPARWTCSDPDPSVTAQGTFTCVCANGGGSGTPPAFCDDCAAAATTGTAACGSVSYCRDPDNGDPGQQSNFECVCNNNANLAAPAANAAPTGTDCDDCAAFPCGAGQTCMDPDGGLPASQLNYVCTCDVTGATSVGSPAATCDDCAMNAAICGVGQTCSDPNTSPATQGNYLCTCDNNGGTGTAAPAAQCDDCAVDACAAAGQLCNDPDMSTGAQQDFTCTCNNGIDYSSAGMGAGVAVGRVSVCPLPPAFAASGSVRVSEELAQVYLPMSMMWVAGPGFAGYSEVWATSITDSEGPGRSDSMTQSREFRLRSLNGTGVNSSAMFTHGPYIDPNGRLTFNLAPNAWGTAVFEVWLVDSGSPSGVPQPTEICPGESEWCRSVASSLVIEVVPENDPPSFNCTNRTIVVQEDAGPVTVAGWGLNISAGPFEALENLEFRVFNDNEGLFSTQPLVDYVQGSTVADLKFEPLRDAEGVATVEVQLWDSGQDVDGSVRRRVASCNLLRIEVLDVNKKPSFSDKGVVQIIEDSGSNVIVSWATSISAGPWSGSKGDQPNNDANNPQTAWFRVNYTDPADAAKFTSLPTIHPITGDLTIHPMPDQNTFGGPVTLNVTLVDSLGLESDVHQLVVYITPVDDPPTFVPGPLRVTVGEGSGLYNETWARHISVGPMHESTGVGPEYEGQLPVFVTEVLSGAELFSLSPEMSPEGRLTFETFPEASGEATVRVTLYDRNPATGVLTAGATHVVTIAVLPVNDPPLVSITRSSLTVEKSAGPQTVQGMLHGLAPGPPDESHQTIRFDVFVNDSSLFADGGTPVVVYAGGSRADIQFEPTMSSTGTANVTVRVIDNGGVVNGGRDYTEAWFLITVTAFNNMPSFVRGADVTVLEDACNPDPCTFSNWAERVTPGLGEEGSQPVTFNVDVQDDNLFSAPLTIDPYDPSLVGVPGNTIGRLSISTASNASGASLASVTAYDNGVPRKSSPQQTFVVRILPVNDPPSFTPGPNLTVEECIPNTAQSCSYTHPGWAANISPGPPDESGQTITFIVDVSDPSLFTVPPTIDPVTGTLRYTLREYQNTAGRPLEMLVTACDTGGVQNGGIDCTRSVFSMTVGSVDSPPRFTPGEDVVVLEDEGIVRRLRWAANSSLGRTGGVTNTGRVVIGCTPDVPELFDGKPSVALPEGDLTFVTAENMHGKSAVTCAFGPTGTSGAQFIVTILPVNDAPRFTLRNLTVPITNITSNGVVLVTAEQTALFDPNLFWAQGVTGPSANVVPFPGVIPGTNMVPGASGSRGVVRQFTSNYVISGKDIVVLENWDGQHPGYLIRYVEPTSMTAGTADEDQVQNLSFEVTCDSNGLFSDGPKMTAGGLMMFSLMPKVSGNAFCSIVLVDDGGTERGGVKRSVPLTFGLLVLDVDNPPTFIRGPNIVVLEDQGAYRSSWATSVTSGAANEQQQVQLTFSNLTNVERSRFVSPPLFDPWPSPSVLSFTTAPDEFGEVTGVVQATDSGGAASEAVVVTINIIPVNDAPVFTMLTPKVTLPEDSGYYSNIGVADVAAGPGNEAEQQLRFEITPVGGETLQFAEIPRISLPTGLLTFLVEKDAWGTQQFRVCLHDNGGTSDGGVDSTCKDLTVQVLSVNDPPTAVTSGTITAHEDSGTVKIAKWLSVLNSGPANESPDPVAVVSTGCPSSPVLFSTQPVVSWPSGDVTFTVVPNAFGFVNCSVAIRDAGGVTAQIPLAIEVLNVNDPPTYSPLFTEVTWAEDGGRFERLFANKVSPGPSNENTQGISFVLTPVDARVSSTDGTGDPVRLYTASVDPYVGVSRLFAGGEEPTVTILNGESVLRFTPSADQYGTVVFRAVLQDTGGVSYNGKDSSDTVMVTINIFPVNDPPTANTTRSEVIVLEDQGAITIPGWAHSTPGALTENWQTVHYVVSWPVLNSGVFTKPPAVHGPSGDLLIDLTRDAHGEASFTVKAVDNGGTANGGVDESPVFSLKIIVRPVNDPPYVVFGNGAGVAEVPEDTELLISRFVKEISPGNGETSDQTVKVISTLPENSNLVDQITLFEDGGLYVRPQKDVSGETTAWATLKDNAGVANGGIDTSMVNFTVRVLPVNDPPEFDVFKNTVEVDEDCGLAEALGVVGNPVPGPADEAQQTVTYRTTVSNPSALQGLPVEVTPLGAMRFTPAADFNGEVTVNIQACDDGGSLNNGEPCSAFKPVLIKILPINDAPVFTPGPHDIHIPNNAQRYSKTWATGIAGGPAYENQQVEFKVRSVGNPGIFSPDGMPVMTANGTLLMTPNREGSGTSSVTVYLVDSEGLVSLDYVFYIHTYPGGAGPVVAVVDQDLDTFQNNDFEDKLESLMKLPSGCVDVLTTQPGSTRVQFAFVSCASSETPAQLTSRYLSAVTQTGSRLRADLFILDTYSESVGNNTEAVQPSSSSSASGVDYWVWILVGVACLMLLLCVVAAVLGRRFYLKSKRKQEQREKDAVGREGEPTQEHPSRYFSQPPSSSTLQTSNPIESTFAASSDPSNATLIAPHRSQPTVIDIEMSQPCAEWDEPEGEASEGKTSLSDTEPQEEESEADGVFDDSRSVQDLQLEEEEVIEVNVM